jgi:hypothetical protein
MILSVCAVLLGCGPDIQPSVTLTERKRSEDTLVLAFRFTDLDRAGVTAVCAEVIEYDKRPTGGGARFENPGPEFILKVGLGRGEQAEEVVVLPQWGPSVDGEMTTCEFCEVVCPDDRQNSVIVPGTAGQHVAQSVSACAGLDKPVTFDADDGIDVITLGYNRDKTHLRVWCE